MTTSSSSLGVTQLTAPCRIAMPRQPLAALIAAAGDKGGMRFLEFFAARIRNPNTRRVYGRALVDFLAWCDDNQVPSIAGVQPLHAAAWIELQQQDHAAPIWPRPICGRPFRPGATTMGAKPPVRLREDLPRLRPQDWTASSSRRRPRKRRAPTSPCSVSAGAHRSRRPAQRSL